MKLSLCMIVRDEEEVIERCLLSAQKFADEIIVVDTGSRDSTISIAQKYAKVYSYKWQYDFSDARNYSFSLAQHELIMWLDADDIVLDEDAQKIIALKNEPQLADVYMFDYVMSHEDDWTPIYKFSRERIFNKSKNFKWVDAIHEVIIPSGNISRRDIKIYHEKIKPTKKGRNLQIYRKMIAKNVEFSPRQQFYYARELMFNGFYKRAISQFKRFIRSGAGWSENIIQAHIDLADCYEKTGDYALAIKVLLSSLSTFSPRSEVLYRLGGLFLKRREYEKSIFWYAACMNAARSYPNGAFVENDTHDFLPALQLCYVHSLLGEMEKSYKYHLICQKLKPKDSSVLHNKNFFDNYFENNRK